MPATVGVPTTAFLSTAEIYIDSAIENDGSSNAVLAQETVESDHQKLNLVRERDKANTGQVQAVMAALRPRDASDFASRGRTQKELIAQIDAQAQQPRELAAHQRELHRREMADTRPVASLAQARAAFEAVAIPPQLKPLTAMLNRLTRALTEKLRPDRGAYALSQLEKATADPVARLAVMQLARTTLIDAGFEAEAAQLDEAIADTYKTHGEQIRAVSNTAASAETMFSTHAQRDKFRRFYLQTLSADLTPRYLFDGLLELGGVDDFDRTARVMANALSDDMLAVRTSLPRDQLTRLYSYISLFNRAQVARTMLANARQLTDMVNKAGNLDEAKRSAKALEICREFFSLAQASLPGPLIDRIADRAGDKSAVARSTVLHLLYRDMPKWPELVWVNAEVRESVRKQVLKRLDQAFESHKRVMFYAAGVGDRYLIGGAA